MDERKICFFCKFWDSNPSAMLQKQRIAAEDLSGRIETNVPMMYGKCRAEFINKDNEPETIEKGTASLNTCDVYDHDGYQVFQRIPED